MPSPEQNTSGNSNFSRNILTLVTGTTISQILTILAAPLITRLYGPESFGLLALFTSITSIISVIVCLRYEFAIMLPASDEEAANVFGLCILIIFAVSILLIPILALSRLSLESLLNSPQIGDFIWLVPISIFLSGMFLALNYWNTRTQQFNSLAIAQVMKSCSSTGTQLGFGVTGYASGGILIGASVIGQLVSTFVLGIQIMKDHIVFFTQHITMSGMFAVMKRYSDFPKYAIWAALLNSFTLMLPVFILTAYFNPTIVGYYSLGLMVLYFPLSFVQGAITQVFFQRAADAKNISHQKLKETVGQTIKPLIFLAFFPIILFILIGPEIFSVIFGAQWEESGRYIRFLSIWVGLSFISSPISSLFSILEKQQMTLILTIIELIFPFTAMILGAMTGNALVAIILFALVSFFTNMVAYIYLLRLVGIPITVPAKMILHYLLLSIPFILCTLIFQRVFFQNNALIVVLSVTIFMLLPLLLIKKDPEISVIFKSVTTPIPIINMIAKYLY